MLDGSPLSLIERASSGGLTAGELGLILSPAGLGKTALLVHLGLEDLLGRRCVLHVSEGESIAEICSRYEELLADYDSRGALPDPIAARTAVQRHRMVQSYTPGGFSTQKLTQLLGILAEHADFRPEVILLDGLDWSALSRAEVASYKARAWAHGTRLWVTTLSEPASRESSPAQLPAAFEPVAGLIDLAVQLRSRGEHVELQLCGQTQESDSSSEPMLLEPSHMRAVFEGNGTGLPVTYSPDAYTLYSGAAAGSEAYFGEVAERYGLAEVNYSYPGHEPARERGLVMLSERELRQGDVSLAYASRRMHRGYDSTHAFRRVLQTLWHQVHSADQVLVVGSIQDDDTLSGGTGWAGELARVWNKALWVYDQEEQSWFRWSVREACWRKVDTPRITSVRVCGTGTRKLSESGRAAIDAVFAATFVDSAPPSA